MGEVVFGNEGSVHLVYGAENFCRLTDWDAHQRTDDPSEVTCPVCQLAGTVDRDTVQNAFYSYELDAFAVFLMGPNGAVVQVRIDEVAAYLTSVKPTEVTIHVDVVEGGKTLAACRMIGSEPNGRGLHISVQEGVTVVRFSDTDEEIIRVRGFAKAMDALARKLGYRVEVAQDYGVVSPVPVGMYGPERERDMSVVCERGEHNCHGSADGVYQCLCNCHVFPGPECHYCHGSTYRVHGSCVGCTPGTDARMGVERQATEVTPEPEVKRCGCGNLGCGHVGGCEAPATVGTLCVPCHVTLDSVRPDSCDVPADECPVKVHTCVQPYVTGCVACEWAAPVACYVTGCVFRTDAVEVLFRHVDTEHGAATGPVFEIFNSWGIDGFFCSQRCAHAYIAEEVTEAYQAQYQRENVRTVVQVPLMTENGKRVTYFDRCLTCRRPLPREAEPVATPTPTAGEVFRMTSDPVGWFDSLTRTGEPVKPFRAKNGKRKTFVQRHGRKRVNR